jgi:hypothetical protein
MEFLPEEFHVKTSILQIFKLAREDWDAMSSDQAELVVLSIGLTLRDIAAVQFIEGDEEDVPEWVQHSPYNMEQAHKLLEVWSQQLPVEDSSGEESSVAPEPTGKGKAKARGRSGKRKAKSADEGSDASETHLG